MPSTRVPLRWKALQSAYTDGLDRPLWCVHDTYRKVSLVDDERGGFLFFSKTDATRKAAELNRVEKASRR